MIKPAPKTNQQLHGLVQELHGRARRTRNTGELRRLARTARKEIREQYGLKFLVELADELVLGAVRHRTLAVLLLEDLTENCGLPEFRLFERWLGELDNWGDHDGVVHYLIGPMMAIDPARVVRVFAWAESSNRWKRRAAAVALIQSARRQKHFSEIMRITEMLRSDQDDMVQKGLGWLLRETAKADRDRATSFLMTNRNRLPRLVLRNACETLPEAARARILAR